MTWLAVGALAIVCVVMRVAVPLGFGDHRPPWLDRALATAVPGLLAALIVTGAATHGRHLQIDARAAGLAAGLVAIILRAPMLLVIVAAAAVAAGVRLL